MIHAFPKKHMIAAGLTGAAMTLVLLLSPSGNVNATRTSIPLELNKEIDQLSANEQIDLSLSHVNSATQEKLTQEPKIVENWDAFTVKNGDTLSNIFKKAGLNDKVMYQVLYSSKETKDLANIFPGEKLAFLLDEENALEKVRLIRSPLETVYFSKNENGKFSKSIEIREPEVHIAFGEGTIDSSLFLAGQKAGLSQSQIMELTSIFGWDIDFILDIRKGDKFSLIYEELFLDGEKYKNGRILAANFKNQKRDLSAVLYEQKNGASNYFTPDGKSMRKAFIRTPVDFARISSHFNLRRKHPILHKIRAHKGTDYAAATGTPIKATGDGKVIHAARKGGYGKTVIIQHGQNITTLYAHMNGYARGIRSGKRVKQGQIIGYVGSTGRSTGPHLHYEFRVNGVHKNSLKVKLPHASPVPKKEMARFKEQTGTYMAQLDTFSESYQLASNP